MGLKRLKKGFSLIELLIVLFILMALVAMVLVVLNPAGRMADARNARREIDVKTILETIKDNQIRNGGALIAGIDPYLRMIGTAGSGCGVKCGGGDVKTFSTRILASADDAEEKQLTGGRKYMYLTSGDLELTYEDDHTPQLIGMRFRSIPVPQGARILNAYIEFTVDERTSIATNLIFYGEAADNAAEFNLQDGNITARPRTLTSVPWNNVPAWTEYHAKHQTPDLSPVIEEIAGRPGWQKNNALSILVDGTGERTARTFDGTPSEAPLLFIEYESGVAQEACLDLSSSISTIPLDPKYGSQEKTYYAVKALNPDTLKVVSCGSELSQEIELSR